MPTLPNTRDALVAALDAQFQLDVAEEAGWESTLAVVYEQSLWRDYVEPRWAARWNGLMIKGGDAITGIASCVFPSDRIIARLKPGTFMFTEHPIDDAFGDVFAPWSKASFERMKRDGISVYTVHAPLEHHPELSPSRIVARALGLKNLIDFLPTAKGLTGGIGALGDTDLEVTALAGHLQQTLGADIPVRVVSAPRPLAGRVAVVAGDGAEEKNLEQALALGCTTFITGNAASPCAIPFVRDIHQAFLRRAAEAGVAVIDGTHYGTERPAHLAMVEWFTSRGLSASFEPGRPERA